MCRRRTGENEQLQVQHSGHYTKIAAVYCHWFDHHKDEAFSFKDSLTALRRAGISF